MKKLNTEYTSKLPEVHKIVKDNFLLEDEKKILKENDFNVDKQEVREAIDRVLNMKQDFTDFN